MKVRVICTGKNFYPRSPCGERLHYDNYNLHCVEISIHALLAESDRNARPETRPRDAISIHALLAESDLLFRLAAGSLTTFLSTLSLRRATVPWLAWLASCFDFYPRSPCGERHTNKKTEVYTMNFYPRSPCGERRYFRVV